MLILCHNQFGLAAMSLATRSTYLRKSMLTAPMKSSAARPQRNRFHLTRSHERTHHMDTDIASPMSSLRHWIVSKGLPLAREHLQRRFSTQSLIELVEFNSFWPRCCWPGTISWAAGDWQQLHHSCDANHNNGDSVTESCIHMHTYQYHTNQFLYNSAISLNICLGWLLAASPYTQIILCLTCQCLYSAMHCGKSFTATHHISTGTNSPIK